MSLWMMNSTSMVPMCCLINPLPSQCQSHVSSCSHSGILVVDYLPEGLAYTGAIPHPVPWQQGSSDFWIQVFTLPLLLNSLLGSCRDVQWDQDLHKTAGTTQTHCLGRGQIGQIWASSATKTWTYALAWRVALNKRWPTATASKQGTAVISLQI